MSHYNRQIEIIDIYENLLFETFHSIINRKCFSGNPLPINFIMIKKAKFNHTLSL